MAYGREIMMKQYCPSSPFLAWKAGGSEKDPRRGIAPSLPGFPETGA
jgi:hypothetical protein